ncbi:hypothetical protein Pmani_029847 [Petrolisthes manimaculis]|uniref:Uncharacterized protein n=1 Tax=Petrolisthes manimaculis TaxID=1843537 RepID=A0AAE1NZ62_9EUCA|nr:hypothetical protein Pmani_029847 [Petrolisthes manimaculis]
MKAKGSGRQGSLVMNKLNSKSWSALNRSAKEEKTQDIIRGAEKRGSRIFRAVLEGGGEEGGEGAAPPGIF